ncbi:NAD-dependent epimerase/dehydratase family protein [Methylotuvimicrobium alcaliphilum]|uniref:NAD-dependent epimerase/dehydratase n=1 Tax=Methylotuvimicrobium alcaliphilum (strain DSM 19304 / NCIMB 14124 / VKM B-2133 / 20Z) TaxID=1091494 RepID=G4SWA8_META2|nr:NAD(P)-dependent oxidoreductase [Methylotuvimicrobium alcaliphilum]CCE23023.1 putative NAD-dependent epimerase/dehydratase [Methylotuvimicrobium alcaliphilum 20Z]
MVPSLKVAVTGASGFVGKRLVERLCSQGHSVVCLLRPTSNALGLERPQVELKRGFLTDAGFVGEVLTGCDVVIHCAALVSDWGTVHEIKTANVGATRILVKEAAKCGISHFIHVSTTDVYGHSGKRGVSEDHRPADKFANWYAETKKEAEGIVSASSVVHTILRPATIYGPGSKTLVGEIAKAVESGFMLLIDGGKQCAGLTYIDNLIDAIELTLFNENAFGEVFNVSDASSVTWAEFVDHIALGLGSRYRKISLPYPLAFRLGHFLESGYRHVRGVTGLQTQALLSRQAVQVLGVHQDFSIDKARSRLGFEPAVPFDQGIEKSIEWVKGQML